MWRDQADLLDILLAARKARSFVQTASWKQFESNEVLQNACISMLEMIGEAARNVSADFRSLHPEIPWADMIGLRHRLIHEYSRINLMTVWDTLQKNLPQLIDLIEPLVPDQSR